MNKMAKIIIYHRDPKFIDLIIIRVRLTNPCIISISLFFMQPFV